MPPLSCSLKNDSYLRISASIILLSWVAFWSLRNQISTKLIFSLLDNIIPIKSSLPGTYLMVVPFFMRELGRLFPINDRSKKSQVLFKIVAPILSFFSSLNLTFINKHPLWSHSSQTGWHPSKKYISLVSTSSYEGSLMAVWKRKKSFILSNVPYLNK